MSGYDTGRLYSAQVLSGNDASRAPDAPAQTEASLFDFVQRFRLGADYVYRDRLRANLLAKQYVLEVMLEHVQLWNVGLAQLMRTEPGEILPLVSAVRGVVMPGRARLPGMGGLGCMAERGVLRAVWLRARRQCRPSCAQSCLPSWPPGELAVWLAALLRLA